MSASEQWNPYFVAFAHSRGSTPEAMPMGGPTNREFMPWIMGQWREWARERGFRDDDEARRRIRDAATDFGAWLAKVWP